MAWASIFDKIKAFFHFQYKGGRKTTQKQKGDDSGFNIQAESVKVGGDAVGRDKNIFAKTDSDTMLSNLEKMALKCLYLKYTKDNLPPRDKIITIFSKLEVKNGSYVGTLNDSKYLKIEGKDIVMTSAGIRFMDNLSVSEKRDIVLPEEKRLSDKISEKQRLMMEENKRHYYRNSNK